MSEIQSSEKQSKEVTKPLTHAEAREFLIQATTNPIDPAHLLDQIANTFHAYRESEDNSEVSEKFKKYLTAAVPVIALDTHFALAGAVIEDLRTLAIDLADQMVVEYDCKTPTEKTMVEVAVAAYIRVIQFTGYMTRLARDERVSDLLNGAYRVASQELDRANRHFLSTITALKQLKAPTMTVQVKATNAFVAQNQQVNATSPITNAGNDKPVYANVDPT